ncbi:TraR/DksA family transcriptional regulator [Candidatus Binatus sp.]|jgi:RNA polymerase-binding transcription factor DksA
METSGRQCSECGEQIAAARLKARPETTLCVGCKTKIAKREKTKTHENPEKVERKSRIRPTHIKPEDVG